MPFNHYLTSLKFPAGDARATAFARACPGPANKLQREFFYTEGDWVRTPDLHATLAGYTTGDATTAEVWFAGDVPRAIYLWEVDLEYQRDSLFCLDNTGTVTKAVSRFFPSASGEPREHWVYIRTTHPGPGDSVWVSIAHYEDAPGNKLSEPSLSAEDKDFIRGEREYHYWNDFDFAKLSDKAPVHGKPGTDGK